MRNFFLSSPIFWLNKNKCHSIILTARWHFQNGTIQNTIETNFLHTSTVSFNQAMHVNYDKIYQNPKGSNKHTTRSQTHTATALHRECHFFHTRIFFWFAIFDFSFRFLIFSIGFFRNYRQNRFFTDLSTPDETKFCSLKQKKYRKKDDGDFWLKEKTRFQMIVLKLKSLTVFHTKPQQNFILLFSLNVWLNLIRKQFQ